MSFQKIKGQDKPIAILKSYLKSGSFAGAYLFTGQEGIGKFLTAKNFAKAINCFNKKDDCCDICPSCLKIDKAQHPDIYFIGAESRDTIKIEAIRNLKKDMSLRPYEARKRVFLINDAHNFNAEAANAILKSLEEPAADSLIILVTSKPNLLFKTAISRCRIIKFVPSQRANLKEALLNEYRLESNLAHFLAYFSEGRIGAALRLKDRADVLNQKNLIIDSFILRNKNVLEMPLLQNRDDTRNCLNILGTWFRDLYLIKTGVAYSELINLDRKSDLLSLMQRYNFNELDEILKSISDSLLYVEQNINIKLLLLNLRETIWKKHFS